jgi:mRNA-degrading endonuclease RelE of RelBE toxin-antitoxin system
MDLKGTPGKRLRAGDFRPIFEEADDLITVTKVGPRGSVYGE